MSFTPIQFPDFGKKTKDLLTKKYKKKGSNTFGVKSKAGDVTVQTEFVDKDGVKTGSMKLTAKPLCNLEIKASTTEQMEASLVAPTLYEGLKLKGEAHFVPPAVFKSVDPKKAARTRLVGTATFSKSMVSSKVVLTMLAQGWPGPGTQWEEGAPSFNAETNVSVGLLKGLSLGGQVLVRNLLSSRQASWQAGAEFTGAPNMIGTLTVNNKKDLVGSYYFSGLNNATVGATLKYGMDKAGKAKVLTPTVGVHHQFSKGTVLQTNFDFSNKALGIVMEHKLGSPAATLQFTNEYTHKVGSKFGVYMMFE